MVTSAGKGHAATPIPAAGALRAMHGSSPCAAGLMCLRQVGTGACELWVVECSAKENKKKMISRMVRNKVPNERGMSRIPQQGLLTRTKKVAVVCIRRTSSFLHERARYGTDQGSGH